jgi:hypothetical protein
MIESRQHDKPPELHVLSPRTMIFADLIEMFLKQADREPTPQESLEGVASIFGGKTFAMRPSGVRLNRWCGSRGPGEGHLGKIGKVRRVGE